MAITQTPRHRLHPIHAVLLGASFPLFLGAFLSDWAYYSSQAVQWINFASWLLAGALVFAGFALLWAVVDLLRVDVPRERSWLLYTVLLGLVFVLGFINSLVHAKDAWAAMPTGMILSAIVFLLALAATWIGFSTLRGDVR